MNIEGGFFLANPPTATQNSDDVINLVSQVAHVNLKRKTDDFG